MKKYREKILNYLMKAFWLVQLVGGVLLMNRAVRSFFYLEREVGIVSEHLLILLSGFQAILFVGLPIMLILRKEQAFCLYRSQLILSCFAFRFSTFFIYERFTGLVGLIPGLMAVGVDVLRHVRIKQTHGDVLVRHKSLQKFSSLIALFVGLGIDLAVLGSSLHRFFLWP